MTENYLLCAQIIPDAGERVRVRADTESFRPLLCPSGTHPSSAWPGAHLSPLVAQPPFLTRFCSLLTEAPAIYCGQLDFS